MRKKIKDSVKEITFMTKFMFDKKATKVIGTSKKNLEISSNFCGLPRNYKLTYVTLQTFFEEFVDPDFSTFLL